VPLTRGFILAEGITEFSLASTAVPRQQWAKPQTCEHHKASAELHQQKPLDDRIDRVCALAVKPHTHRIALADEPNEAAPDDAAASSLCKWADSSTRLSRSSRKQISTLAVEPHEKKRSFGPVTSGCALEQLSRIQGNAVAVKPRPESALAPAQCSDDQAAYRNRSGGRAPPCGRAAYSARSRAASSTQLQRSNACNALWRSIRIIEALCRSGRTREAPARSSRMQRGFRRSSGGPSGQATTRSRDRAACCA